jgi:uncharacterized protein (TIGR03083 family)
MLRPVDPVLATSLFRPDRAALLDLLGGLDPADWDRPTVCAGWSVEDVALHVLGGDLANIAGRRDGQWGLLPRDGETMGAFIDRINRDWVETARRLSPRLIVELLAESGPRLFDHLETLDPMATGGPVTWAGPEPAPVWLDVAREYTERWLHQQHVRDATGRPGQTDPRFLGPVLATFAHALPVAIAGTDAPNGTAVAFEVDGEAGGRWAVVREPVGWTLRAGRPDGPAATLRTDADTAWRLLTLGLDETGARRRVRIEGDEALGARLLRAVAIIA